MSASVRGGTPPHAVLDRVCTVPSYEPNSFAVQLDTTRRAILRNGIPLANGSRSASLPSLGYFVTSKAAGTMAWGARHARTGATYCRYESDVATGKLSYHTEKLHATPQGEASKGCCGECKWPERVLSRSLGLKGWQR